MVSVRDDLKDGAAQRLKRAARRLIETQQVAVHRLSGHWPAVHE